MDLRPTTTPPPASENDDDANPQTLAPSDQDASQLTLRRRAFWGKAKGTVRRWLKGGLPSIADQKPSLILAEDLIQFLASRKAPSQKCLPFECYCVKCRAPRKPAGYMAEYVPLTPKTGNLRAICPACFRLMHKRIRCDALEPLRPVLTVTIAQPVPSLAVKHSLPE